VLTDETTLEGARSVEEADTLSLAFLLLLERLSPVERAVFLLHDVFAYGYDEIATIVGKSAATCRQLAARARRHVRAAAALRGVAPAPRAARRSLLRRHRRW
jgi:RNA polymerase sigma-70 factor, ECF subfamily